MRESLSPPRSSTSWRGPPRGEDRNGMLLSVLSALARLDIDPWQEAAKLAGLLGATATQRLASLIAELPDAPASHPDPATIATRLIALLPRPASPTDRSHTAFRGAGAATHPRAVIYMYVIFMVCALGAQWMAASRQPPAAGRRRSDASHQDPLPAGATANLWPVMINSMRDWSCGQLHSWRWSAIDRSRRLRVRDRSFCHQ